MRAVKRSGPRERERKFVEFYMGKAAGNGKLAAKLAGYKGTEHSRETTASRLLRKAEVRAAIEARVKSDPAVATREDRQRFWTEVMNGKQGGKRVRMADRLKASELLGKSQADFIERHEHGGEVRIVRLPAKSASSAAWSSSFGRAPAG